MNTVPLLIIVAIVGCGLFAILINREIDATGRGWSRDLLSRTELRTVEGLINEPLVFHTVVDLNTVAAKIIAEIAPGGREGSPAELYLVAAESGGDSSWFVLLYCSDGRQPQLIEASVLLKSSGIGTSGSVGMEMWQAVDGVIDTVTIRTARSVREGVRRAVSQLDSKADFSDRN